MRGIYTLCDYIPFNAKLSSSKSRLNQLNALFCLCFTFYLLSHTHTHTHSQIFKYLGDGQRLRLQNPARKAAVPDPAAVYSYTVREGAKDAVERIESQHK